MMTLDDFKIIMTESLNYLTIMENYLPILQILLYIFVIGGLGYVLLNEKKEKHNISKNRNLKKAVLCCTTSQTIFSLIFIF